MVKQVLRPIIRNVRTAYQKITGVKFRYDISNHLIAKNNFKSYLEIGVQDGYCLQAVRCAKKVGVDPNPRVDKVSDATIFKMTSDDFFRQNNDKFDFVFIDGLHTHEQSLIDFQNAEKVLNPGGMIMFHDSNPPTAEYAKSFKDGGVWNGDVFKTIVLLNSTGKYRMLTVDVDFGCAVFQKQDLQSGFQCELSYDWFDKNRKQAINLVSWNEFVNTNC
jgi:hypothetical protein